MSVPRALSQVLLPPFPTPSPSARPPVLPSPPRPPVHRSQHLYLDVVNHLRIYHDDILSPHARLALSYYLDLAEHPHTQRRPSLLGAIGRMLPVLEMCNDWLEEREAMVRWGEKEWPEGGFGFVARTVGRSGRWVDVVELRIEQEGSPLPTTTAGAFVRTPFWASWGSDTLMIGGVTRNGYESRITEVLVADYQGYPVVIPSLGYVGRLNQVGALAGLALVGEAGERAWEELHEDMAYASIPSNVSPIPADVHYSTPAYPPSTRPPTSPPSYHSPNSNLSMPTPNPSTPPSRAETQRPPSPSHKATDDLLAAVTTPSSSFKSKLVQNLIHRAIGNSDLAPVVAQLAKVVLSSSSSTPPKSADQHLSSNANEVALRETNKALGSSSMDEGVKEMLVDALKTAAKAATTDGGLVDRRGLYKLVEALVDLGVLDRTSVVNLFHEVEGGGERGPGHNGYH